MTGPTTEAASISLELKDDAKQERVSRIASRGCRAAARWRGNSLCLFRGMDERPHPFGQATLRGCREPKRAIELAPRRTGGKPPRWSVVICVCRPTRRQMASPGPSFCLAAGRGTYPSIGLAPPNIGSIVTRPL